jgi:membrane-associated phospholipid phosphatase
MMWNPRRLLFNQALIAFLLLILFIPYTHSLLTIVDSAFFHFLNGNLEGHPNWQYFWAIANHKLTDWAHDVVFLILIVSAVLAAPKGERLKKTSQFLFCILYIAFIIFFFNRLLFRESLDIVRFSPTMEFSDSIRLSKEFPGLGIKDSSKQSFPGDHATTALLLAVSYSYYANKKLAILGWIYAIFMCLPRLVAGAHWLSDVVIGSGCIVLFFLSWAFYSPFGAKTVSMIERVLRFVLRKPLTV